MSRDYQAQINEQHTINIDQETIENADIHWNKDGSLHLLHAGKSFTAELIHLDSNTKRLTIRVNSAQFEVKLKDPLDMLIDKMGMKVNQRNKSADIIAPMPGLVMKILVESGQSTQQGQPILILEAMKMENVLKAEGNGIVKSINIKKGDSVEKGQILVEIEPES